MRFYVGLHQPSDAKHFDRAFISVNRLWNRKSGFAVGRWIMDSGAFSEISTHGRFRHTPERYAQEIRRWIGVGQLEAAVTQDWMCEPWITEKTGLTVLDHQRLTIERYDATLAADPGVYLMPVLQGYEPGEYRQHIRMWGDRLPEGAWVGVGSVCKRNGSPVDVLQILSTIKVARPDLRLHGFGLKKTALEIQDVRELLHTADSMAWSYAARIEGRNGNDYREAQRFMQDIERNLRPWRQGWQQPLPLEQAPKPDPNLATADEKPQESGAPAGSRTQTPRLEGELGRSG